MKPIKGMIKKYLAFNKVQYWHKKFNEMIKLTQKEY